MTICIKTSVCAMLTVPAMMFIRTYVEAAAGSLTISADSNQPMQHMFRTRKVEVYIGLIWLLWQKK